MSAADPLFDLNGRRAVVTGAGSGIGLMVATGLAARGVEVIAVGRDTGRLAAVGGCRAVVADVTTAAGRATIADAVTPGALDILVANAGITGLDPLGRAGTDRFEAVMRTNVAATFATVGALHPALRAAASADHPARVIVIASIDGLRVPRWDAFAYAASKAGVIHLARHLAASLARDAITVNAIAPGLFPSRMTAFLFDEAHPHHRPAEPIPLGRTGRADDVVGAVVYLASRAGSYVTGATLPVAGGLATAD